MADNYTASLRLTQPAVAGDNGTWGGLLNTDMTLIEQAITGNPGISLAGLVNYTMSVNNGAVDDARSQIYTFTGASNGNGLVTMPSVVKSGWASNQTSAGYSVSLGTGAGRQAILPFYGNNGPPWLYSFYTCDGTNVDNPPLFANNFYVPNQGVYGAYDTTGVPQPMLYMDSANTVWIAGNANASGTLSMAVKSSNGTTVMIVGKTGNVGFGPGGTAPITNAANGMGFQYATGQSQFYSSSLTPVNIGTGNTNLVVFYHAGANLVGSITTGGASVSYNTTSDYRLKDIIGEWKAAEQFDRIVVYEGAWKTHPAVHQPMILAHELADVFPFAVGGEKDAVTDEGNIDPQQVDFIALIPALMAEIKELRQQVRNIKLGRHG
jgi:hypothetical protein